MKYTRTGFLWRSCGNQRDYVYGGGKGRRIEFAGLPGSTGAVPAGLGLFSCSHPALPCRAIMCRRFAAGAPAGVGSPNRVEIWFTGTHNREGVGAILGESKSGAAGFIVPTPSKARRVGSHSVDPAGEVQKGCATAHAENCRWLTRERGNGCWPCGTRAVFLLSPGTAVPGYHVPPLRGWSPTGFAPPLARLGLRPPQLFQSSADRWIRGLPLSHDYYRTVRVFDC
jgi:hypothetical protein